MRYGFESIRSADEFRSRVPIVRYDDLKYFIDRIGKGEKGVLTSEPVDRLIPSSGSTAAIKYIPWTRTLAVQFGCAIGPWIVDFFRQYPDTMNGPAFWSISPSFSVEAEPGMKIPVGFDDDSAYIGGWLRSIVRSTMAVPDSVRLAGDIAAFRYILLLFLLSARELRVISIWHPSYLSLLMASFDDYRDELISDLSEGKCRPPGKLDPLLCASFERSIRPNQQRACEIDMAGNSNEALWPHLKVIMCWSDAHAHEPAMELRRMFPQAMIHSRGLLATEGSVSIPYGGLYPAAVCSHFFEFIDDTGRSRLVHELNQSERYSVVLTTGGGLYRYALGDSVQVDGFSGMTPSLRFTCRTDKVSDFRGEKLNEQHVSEVLDHLLAEMSVTAVFSMLAPEERRDGIGYTLYIESWKNLREGLAVAMDNALKSNPHYAYCRSLGQLLPVRVFRVDSGGHHEYLRAMTRSGVNLGSIKPSALAASTGWDKVFSGRHLIE